MPLKTPVKKKADKKPTKKPAKKPAGAIKKMTQKQTNTQIVNVKVNTPNAPKQTRRKRASKPPAPEISLGDYSRMRVSALREQVPATPSYITQQGDMMVPVSKLLGGLKHHPTENLTPAEMRDNWANRFADLGSNVSSLTDLGDYASATDSIKNDQHDYFEDVSTHSSSILDNHSRSRIGENSGTLSTHPRTITSGEQRRTDAFEAQRQEDIALGGRLNTALNSVKKSLFDLNSPLSTNLPRPLNVSGGGDINSSKSSSSKSSSSKSGSSKSSSSKSGSSKSSSSGSSSSNSLPSVEIESNVPPPTGNTQPITRGEKITINNKKGIRDFYGVQTVGQLKQLLNMDSSAPAEKVYEKANKRTTINWYKKAQVKKA